jgi:hypothetical protein
MYPYRREVRAKSGLPLQRAFQNAAFAAEAQWQPTGVVVRGRKDQF